MSGNGKVSEARRPQTIFFFPNGNVAVCDQFGQQMPRYQRHDSHAEAIAALAADGIDWRKIPDRRGEPVDTIPRSYREFIGTEPEDIARLTRFAEHGWTLSRIAHLVWDVQDNYADSDVLEEFSRLWMGEKG